MASVCVFVFVFGFLFFYFFLLPMVVMQLWVWVMVASSNFGGYFNRLCDGGCWVVLTSYGYCCDGWLWQLVVA